MKLKVRFLRKPYNYLKENRILLLIFIIVTFMLIILHMYFVSWDFMAYSLNSKFMFNNGYYFEWLRPPVIPVVLGLFGLLFGKFSEVLYIIFVSSIYFASAIMFARRYKIDERIFYVLTLTPFTLVYGLMAGGELFRLQCFYYF